MPIEQKQKIKIVIHKSVVLRYIHRKNRSLYSSDYPKYELIKDLVHHILSGCDVYYGLRCHGEFFKQVLMLLRAIAHWETSLHGVELIPSLDLCRVQRHHRTVTNAMEGNLLNTGWDVLATNGHGGTPSIDGIHGHVRRQMERLQLHRQG